MKLGHFNRFLSKEDLKEKADDWMDATHAQERGDPDELPYGDMSTFARDASEGRDSVDKFHYKYFIRSLIPSLIERKPKGEKVRILDVGAGAATFSDKIRQIFGDKVIVFSTGLSKKTARDYRKENKQEGEQKLHPNDLKWRSVLELSDFPEFDLIIDTVGEFTYSLDEGGTPEQIIEAVQEYLTVIIKKLKPGGLGSITEPSHIHNYLAIMNNKDLLKELEEKYNVSITQEFGVLTIRK